MTSRSFSPLRRALLGAMAASVALPRLSFSQQRNDPTRQESTHMRIKLIFNNQDLIVTLHDNPSARDFLSLLPLDLMIDDHGSNEKIAYLPRKLTEQGSRAFDDAAPGDFGYFAPWGNLAMYYGSYHYSEGVIRLGRFESSFEPLLTRGKFPLRIERIP
ncbi:cyclophilin-like fold protein [Microvirga sp. RSM25]|jgi:hypothetical protein|uniref:cyclophilin-like fold protein n=1 Tax=Microvirga sp. RSM25 TaxID=3273802 RepID=UPI00384E8E97